APGDPLRGRSPARGDRIARLPLQRGRGRAALPRRSPQEAAGQGGQAPRFRSATGTRRRLALRRPARAQVRAMNETVLRLDKWLWHARFCKSRTLAAKLAAAGKIRISGTLVFKAHHTVKPGDVLTFPLGPHIRTVKVLALGERRGPAPEARLLYEDL